MTPKPRPSDEERLRLALEAALAREGDERAAFLKWLRAADPELCLDVEARLVPRRGDRPPGPVEDA
ncbi:MAG: hypothetical protein R6X22_13660 [Gemmatimonadota bacterium]